MVILMHFYSNEKRSKAIQCSVFLLSVGKDEMAIFLHFYSIEKVLVHISDTRCIAFLNLKHVRAKLDLIETEIAF